MSKRKTVKLQDVCSSIVRGPFGSALKKEYFVGKSEDAYKVYEQKNAIKKDYNIGEYYIDEHKYKELIRFKVEPNDIIISCSGTIGEIYQLPFGCEKGVINQALLKLTLADKIDSRFFQYFWKSSIKSLSSRGSGIQNISSVNYIKDMSLPLPKPDDQKHISDTLDKTQEIIDCHKKQFEELDNLIKATFYDMFGNPIENLCKWERVTINDILEIVDGDRGINYPKQEDFSDSGYCIFLNTGNITADGFNFDKVQYISQDKDNQLRKGKLVRGDIVFTTRGTVGNLAYYDSNILYNTMRINSGMVLLRKKTDTLNPIFFCVLFKNIDMVRYYKTFLSGTAQPQLPITNMKKINLILPPIEIQNKFAQIVTNIEEQKAIVKKSLTESQNLFNSLMSKYFD